MILMFHKDQPDMRKGQADNPRGIHGSRSSGDLDATYYALRGLNLSAISSI
jgi:hypothetical protein